jgi:TrmH family RNA methyltransferase
MLVAQYVFKEWCMLSRISSIKDEKIILARAIKSRKGRQEYQRILLEGEEILEWARENALGIEYILASDKVASSIVDKYSSRHDAIFVVSEGILKKVTDTNYVIPVIGVAKIPSKNLDSTPHFVVVLDAVQDFGNIGTIIRTCQAFGIRKIISTTHDFDIYHRKTIEASRGSVFATHLESFQSEFETLTYLRKQGYQIVATSPKGAELQSLVELKRAPVALVVGNETTGICPEFEKHADVLLQIPMFHPVESLNVGVATGISIYELKLKQVLAMIEERIKSTLGRELNVAGMLVRQAFDVELRKVSELSSRQVIFMMVLKCDQKMWLTDMCKQFGMLESEAEEFLTPMLTSGLVVMNGELGLTSKGEEVLAKLWVTIESIEGKILSGFTVEEATTLMAQLHQIQERCVQIMHGN